MNTGRAAATCTSPVASTADAAAVFSTHATGVAQRTLPSTANEHCQHVAGLGCQRRLHNNKRSIEPQLRRNSHSKAHTGGFLVPFQVAA